MYVKAAYTLATQSTSPKWTNFETIRANSLTLYDAIGRAPIVAAPALWRRYVQPSDVPDLHEEIVELVDEGHTEVESFGAQVLSGANP